MQFNPASCYINKRNSFNGTFNSTNICIAPWAKEVGLNTLPRLIALISGRKMTIISYHVLIFLTGTAADENTNACFHATSIKILGNGSVGTVNTRMIEKLIIPYTDTVEKS